MIVNMTGGGGGASLNFDVVAYATEAALLAATPKDNTIGIITTRAINGWVFSATAPESPASGMVWITVGTSSTIEFNALKKNAIQVYPLSAQQYVGGAWANVDAYCYQLDAWSQFSSEWSGLLYDNGDQVTSITGGWEANANMKIDGASNNAAYIDFNGDSICLRGDKKYIVNTVSKINVDNYNTLCFDVSTNSSASDAYGILSEYGEVYNLGVAGARTTKSGRQQVNVDISGITGSYYVFAGAYERSVYIYKVWME